MHRRLVSLLIAALVVAGPLFAMPAVAGPAPVSGPTAFGREIGSGGADHAHAPGVAAYDHPPAFLSQPQPAAEDRARAAKKANKDKCAERNLKQLPKSKRCTHGPDPAPPGIDIDQSAKPVAANTRTAALAADCAGDGVSGQRVQVIYAHVANVASRYDAYLTSFRQWAVDVNQIFQDSAAETGGNRSIRFVHNANCEIVIPDVTLSATGDDTFDNTIVELRNLGFNRTDRKYMLFVDATVYCGIGNLQADDRPGAVNVNNFGPGYGRTDAGCWGAAVPAHELMHNLGGVQDSAPHTTGAGHCVDEYDRMCYPDGPNNTPPMQIVCSPSNRDRRFDCNHDDYYSTNPPAGSYLATHWNAADNGFLINGTTPPPCPDAAFEPDSTPAQAHAFPLDGTETHAFCQSADLDWVSFQATAGATYRIETRELASYVDTILDVYQGNGITPIASDDDGNGARASLITFSPATAGTFYVRVRDYYGTDASTGFTYKLRITRAAPPTDTTPPSAPTLTLTESAPGEFVSGTTLYYNPGPGRAASFAVAATTADAESGIASVAFPAVFGDDALTDAAAPFGHSYSWTAGATASGAKTVTATNGAGLTASATFSVTPDTVGPTAAIGGPAAGATVRNGQLISVSAADQLTGVAQVAVAYCAGPTCAFADATAIGVAALTNGQYTVTWNGQPANGEYTLVARATDHVGNATDSAGRIVTVRNDSTPPPAPALTLVEAEPDAHADNATKTLYYDASGTHSGAFTVRAVVTDPESGIAGVNFPSGFGVGESLDTVAPYARTYRWTAGATDAGNRLVSAHNQAGLSSGATFTIRPDSGNPTAAISNPPAGAVVANGQVIRVTAGDAISGVAQVEVRYCPGSTCAFANGTPIGTDTTTANGAYALAWTNQPANGPYTLVARATDRVGRVVTTAPVRVRVGNGQAGQRTATAATDEQPRPAVTDR